MFLKEPKKRIIRFNVILKNNYKFYIKAIIILKDFN